MTKPAIQTHTQDILQFFQDTTSPAIAAQLAAMAETEGQSMETVFAIPLRQYCAGNGAGSKQSAVIASFYASIIQYDALYAELSK